MGIKDIIAKFIHRDSGKKRDFEEDQHIAERFIEKKKSSNERELDRFMKEEREENIKIKLEEFRNKRKNEIRYGHQALNVKNMFANDKNELLQNGNLMKKEDRLFNGGNMFFK